MDLYSPEDFEEAVEVADAACGHGALAAALGVPVMDAVKHFDKGGWVNVPIMKAAIGRAGKRWRRIDKPNHRMTAVVMVQFTGPWLEPGVPPAAACRYRHWVAVRAGLLWDVNWPAWQSMEVWRSRAPELLPARSTGWQVWGSLEILS